jgi:hypothetical protein
MKSGVALRLPPQSIAVLPAHPREFFNAPGLPTHFLKILIALSPRRGIQIRQPRGVNRVSGNRVACGLSETLSGADWPCKLRVKL